MAVAVAAATVSEAAGGDCAEAGEEGLPVGAHVRFGSTGRKQTRFLTGFFAHNWFFSQEKKLLELSAGEKMLFSEKHSQKFFKWSYFSHGQIIHTSQFVFETFFASFFGGLAIVFRWSDHRFTHEKCFQKNTTAAEGYGEYGNFTEANGYGEYGGCYSDLFHGLTAFNWNWIGLFFLI